MRIESIETGNFKSLVDFRLNLAKFNCLIGLNGAGKSTVLQFIDFLGQQARGDLKGWLKQRNWKATEIASRLTGKKNIDFSVRLVSEHGADNVTWKASFNPTTLHCTSERIETPGAVLEVQKGQLSIIDKTSAAGANGNEAHSEKISFSYEGSVLSQLRNETLTPSLVGFKNYFSSVRSLDLLSPEYLRQRTREAAGSLGLGGQNLSAFLHEMSDERRKTLINDLKRVYPRLQELHAKSLRSGWKQIEISESYEGQDKGLLSAVKTEARHINDGMLRLIAILAEMTAETRFLLFDEIENGINPELVEFVIDKLVNARQQVLVTTHSPMILNFLDDAIAREGVIYLYKTPRGYTKSIPFFAIPSLAEKLTVMGPGEAFVDTNLIDLAREIQSIPEAP